MHRHASAKRRRYLLRDSSCRVAEDSTRVARILLSVEEQIAVDLIVSRPLHGEVSIRVLDMNR